LAQYTLYDIWRGPFHQHIGDTAEIQIDTASGGFTFHPPFVTGEKIIISAKNSQPLRSVPYKNFDPATIANIYAWFDATDAATLTTSGALVTTWASKIGSGRNMASSGSDRPTYVTSGGPNNQSYVNVPGGKYLQVDVTPDVNGIMTVYMVVRQNTWVNNDRIFYYDNINGLDGIIATTGGYYNGYSAYDGISQGQADYNNDIAGWQMVKVEFSGDGKGKISKNKNGGYNYTLNFPSSVDGTDITIDYLGLGNGSGDYDVAEIIVVAGQVDDVQRNLAENYLINKYALGNTGNIIFFGDSHTAGLLSGSTTGPQYTLLTGKELSSDIMNLAVSGTVMWPNGSYTGSTGQNFADQYNDVDPYIRTSGQYIIMQYGTNDGNNPATVGTWKTNYKNYIQHFIDLGVPLNKIIICSPPYTTSPTYGTNTTATTAVVAAIASEMGIKYCDFNGGLQALGINCYTVAGGDEIHLDGPGHRAMADILKAKILE